MGSLNCFVLRSPTARDFLGAGPKDVLLGSASGNLPAETEGEVCQCRTLINNPELILGRPLVNV